MKKLRWPLLIVLLSLAAISVLLFTQKTTLLPPSVPVTVKPAPGGIYTEGFIGSLIRLNPVLDLYNTSDHDLDHLIFSGLMRFDDHGVPQGDLAESWGISQDGKVYNFSLQPKAVWHDGQPVTSDDIIFTVDLMRSDNSTLSPDLKEMWKQVEVIRLDEKTLQFRLPEAFAPFMDQLTFGVLPKHLLDGMSIDDLIQAPYNLQPVGSGPYRYDHLIVEDGQIKGVALRAFKDYYGQKPFIEQFNVRYYPDGPSALEAFQRGDINGISQIPQEILSEALQEPKLHLYTGRLPKMSMVFFNLDNGDTSFLKETDVRRALLMGLNRQWMVDHLLDGQAIISDGPIFPGTWAYYDGIEHVNFDSAGAINLLKKAGYTIPASGGSVRAKKDGASLQFEMIYPDDGAHQAIAEAIQKDWEAIGVAVKITPVPADKLVSDYLDLRNYQAALVDLNLTRSPDPDPYPFWHQAQATSGQNYAKWDDRQASEFLEQARVVADLGERAKLYRNFQVRFSQELPALPLYYPVYTYAVSADVHGVSMGPLFDTSDRYATVTSWFLVATTAAGATQAPAASATSTGKP